MSRKVEVLETVTDSFNLKDHGRSDGNGRNYLVESVKSMIGSSMVQERLKLRELYGYFGHNRRQMSDKMELGEVEVVNHQGKPVVLENVPAAITTAIDVGDDGVVTFTQDILKTPAGYAAKAMRDAATGGWSWAVEGVRTLMGAKAQSFHGFDYVKHPSYVDMNKQSMMLESVGVADETMLVEKMLEGVGFDCGQSAHIEQIWSKGELDANESVYNVMMLESLVEAKSSEIVALRDANSFRSSAMLEAIEKSPVMITDAQASALVGMKTDEDKQVVMALFESLSNGKLSTLPVSIKVPASVAVDNDSQRLSDEIYELGAINMGDAAQVSGWGDNR